jgi:methylthioribose-1-phosphate isomerase
MGNRDMSLNPEESRVCTLIWDGSVLKLLDQRRLPFEEAYLECRSAAAVARAIREMVVRGAPAIGVAAGYGVSLAALEFQGEDKQKFVEHVNKSIKLLSSSRPTAVNLFWALGRMKRVLENTIDLDVCKIIEKLIEEAVRIEKQDLKINLKIGQNGKKIFAKCKAKIRILTHCNAGALATSGYGTALAVIRSLDSEGKIENVIVDETRPFLQGARLTAWELHRDGIPFFIISDNMAGYFMSKGEVDAVLVGADRIAANGDTANKIGTLSLSILAKYFKIPFYVAAPISTVDIEMESGDNIPIEHRNEREVREVLGKIIIPEFMAVKNPAFDVTPAGNITAIITEKEVIYPPYKKNISRIFTGKKQIK